MPTIASNVAGALHDLSRMADAERALDRVDAAIAAGERIAIWAPNAPEWVLIEFAAALAGLTLVTVNPGYVARELPVDPAFESYAPGTRPDVYRGPHLEIGLAVARADREQAVVNVADAVPQDVAKADQHRQARPHHQQGGHAAEERHRLEIALGVIGQAGLQGGAQHGFDPGRANPRYAQSIADEPPPITSM